MKRVKHPLEGKKKPKVAISIRLDLDILSWLIAESAKRGIGYQTLISEIFKNAKKLKN